MNEAVTKPWLANEPSEKRAEVVHREVHDGETPSEEDRREEVEHRRALARQRETAVNQSR
jgi:DNA-binding IclR family transcriptional regulator